MNAPPFKILKGGAYIIPKPLKKKKAVPETFIMKGGSVILSPESYAIPVTSSLN